MLSFYSSLPFTAQEIPVMSHHDVVIICSNLPVGKPLHMCIGNKQVVKYATLHLDVVTFPMQFISMDLI